MSRQKGDIMREVLISIQPKWVEKICHKVGEENGKPIYEKRVEVRKKRPKCEVPFKCYIYETQGRTETPFVDEEGHHIFKGRGQVIGEFVCDRIIDSFLNNNDGWFVELGCLTPKEINEYQGDKAILYGWHITDLVVYDEPMELCEFFQVKAIRGYHKKDEPKTEGINIPRLLNSTRFEVNFLTRPPQSWCYIETRQTAD